MAGYMFDYSKSNNAFYAEINDRYCLTEASRILASKLALSVAHAKAFLKDRGTTEYHHVSKFYNTINYYDVSDEMLETYKEEIKTFKYLPLKKVKKEILFKCWNFEKEQDPRNWSWSLTNRNGNNTYDLRLALTQVLKLKSQFQNEHDNSNHKSTQKKCTQVLAVLNEIEQELITKHESKQKR